MLPPATCISFIVRTACNHFDCPSLIFPLIASTILLAPASSRVFLLSNLLYRFIFLPLSHLHFALSPLFAQVLFYPFTSPRASSVWYSVQPPSLPPFPSLPSPSLFFHCADSPIFFSSSFSLSFPLLISTCFLSSIGSHLFVVKIARFPMERVIFASFEIPI